MTTNKNQSLLEQYGYPKEINDRVQLVIATAESSDQSSLERSLGKVALKILTEVERKTIDPKTADTCFLVVQQYLMDNCKQIKLSRDAEQLLVEGMTLHDLGSEFGADLATMRSYACKLLKKP